MMEKAPGDRFQNYAEITFALDNINHFQYGKKMMTIVETVERRALPRDEGPAESLFDLVPDDMATQGDHLFQLNESYGRAGSLQHARYTLAGARAQRNGAGPARDAEGFAGGFALADRGAAAGAELQGDA